MAFWPRDRVEAGSSNCLSQRQVPPRLASKMGGLPWYSRYSDKYPIPKCAAPCGKNLSLMCQLNIVQLPKAFRDYIGLQSGLFQVRSNAVFLRTQMQNLK